MRDNQNTRKDYMKWLLLGVILVFILSMVPLFYISIYSHPLFDDYSYSLCIRKLIDGGDYSVADMLRASIDETCRTWKVWQGCYSATFFATLQPGVFSSNTYWITTLVLLGGLMISQVLLWKTIAHNLLGCDIKCALIISLLLAEFQIQFVPFIQEAFYWYNGGMAYTFFYSLMCILISVEVRMLADDKRNAFRFATGVFLRLSFQEATSRRH